LLLVGLRKEDHGVDDLNAGICVDIDTVCLFVVGRLCESGMHSSASDFDGDQRVQGSDGRLEWLEGGDLVGKDAKRAVMGAETNTWRDGVFVWTKPGVALGLLEDPVEGGIVSYIMKRTSEIDPNRELDTRVEWVGQGETATRIGTSRVLVLL
jgi:hypothetical protein